MESDTSIPGFRELCDWPTPPARPFRLGLHGGMREMVGGSRNTYYVDLIDDRGATYSFFFERFLGRLCFGSRDEESEDAAFLKKGSSLQIEVFQVLETLAPTSEERDELLERLEDARNYV